MSSRSSRQLTATAAALVSAFTLAAALARSVPARIGRLSATQRDDDAIKPRGWFFPLAAFMFAAVLGGATAAYTAHQSHQQLKATARELTGGEPDRAPPLMIRYGCAGCHSIPGVPGATGHVGPPLSAVGKRVYVGGAALNTPERLIEWLVDPRRISGRSAMPATGLSTSEARDVAAYLYTLQ